MTKEINDQLLDLISPLLYDYVERARLALFPEVNRVVHFNPGAQIPHDDGCSQLYGRVVSVQPYRGGQQSRTPVNMPCGILQWNVRFAMQVSRCVPVINENGIPSPSQMDNAGQQEIRDAIALQEVIRSHPQTIEMDMWSASAVTGGVGAGEWRWSCRVDTCRVLPELSIPYEPLTIFNTAPNQAVDGPTGLS